MSFSAIKGFRKDRREGKTVQLANHRRLVGIPDINKAAFSNKAGDCTLRARETNWELVGLKQCRDLFLTVIVVDHRKGQGSGTSGLMSGSMTRSRMLVCMHLSV